MRFGRCSPQCSMVGALTAITILAPFVPGDPPNFHPAPAATPVMRVEEFSWLDKSLAVRPRLVNTSQAPVGYAGFLGGPHIWTCTSDGKSWEQAEAVLNVCLTGFGEYWLQPGKTHEFTRLSQSPYRRGKPFVKFGTAVFDGASLDWTTGRVVWSASYRVGASGDPELVADIPISKTGKRQWPAVVAAEDRTEGKVRFTFEAANADAKLSEGDWPAFWVRGRGPDDQRKVEAIRVREWGLDWQWRPKPDGRHVLIVEPVLKIPTDLRADAIGVVFHFIDRDVVQFKRDWIQVPGIQERR